MLRAALASLSWTAPHGQVHSRTCRGLASPMAPHAEHARVEGNHRSTRAKVRPCHRALYSNVATNVDQPASATDRASRVRARPDTARSSTAISWFS